MKTGCAILQAFVVLLFLGIIWRFMGSPSLELMLSWVGLAIHYVATGKG